MAIIRNLACFAGQLVGLVVFVAGMSQGIELIQHIQMLQAGGPFTVGALASHVVACTGPLLFGLGIFFGVGALRRWLAEHAGFVERYPNQPWMWRKDWAAKHIRLSNRPAAIALGIAWLFYLGFAVPVAAWGASIKNPGLVWGFAGAIGLFLLGFSRILWVNRRWNKAELRLAEVPGIIGGPLTGVIVLQETFPEGTVFRVVLKCERTTHSSRGEHSSSRTDVLWQDQKLLSNSLAADNPHQTALPVYFAIPFACEPTTTESNVRSRGYRRGTVRSHINWWVEVSLRDDKLMRSAKFEPPVFQTARSSEAYVAEESKVEAFLEKPDALHVLQKCDYRRIETAEGTLLKFSMLQWDVLGALLFTAAACGGIVLAAFRFTTMPIPFFISLIPGVLGVAICVGIYQMLTWSSRVLIGPESIDIEAGFLGFKRKASFVCKKPPHLVVKEEHPGATKPIFAVNILDHADKPVPIVRHLDNKQDGQAVAEWLRNEWKLAKSRAE